MPRHSLHIIQSFYKTAIIKHETFTQPVVIFKENNFNAVPLISTNEALGTETRKSVLGKMLVPNLV